MAVPSGSVGHFQPDVISADFPFWAKMANWTVIEAAAVLVGVNPHKVSRDYGLDHREGKPYLAQYRGVLALARKAYDQNEIEYPDTPAHWVDWAKKRDLPIFPALEREVDRWRTLKPPTETSDHHARIAQLEAKNLQLQAELTKAKSATEQSPALRERESMLKLIIGMAVAGYRYDPRAKRGDSVKEITSDLGGLGLAMIDDTVRKYLREGADLLPPQENGAR